MTRNLHLGLLLAGLSLSTACGDKDPGLPTDTGSPSVDSDGDGFTTDEDCDDDDPGVHPGAAEICDEVDNDCDGEIDEEVAETWYPDVDGDGWGDESAAIAACEPRSGYVQQPGDCDDDDPETYPDAEERCDGVDNDCDGEVDDNPTELWYADSDADGYGNASFPIESCDPGEGWASNDSDCDDTDAAVNPGAEELCNEQDDNCDGQIDEDLDELWYADLDGDGYGDPATSVEACAAGSGWVLDDSDCDDRDAMVHPAADEVCNGVDDDCDGSTDDDDAGVLDQSTWYLDDDGDGYGLDSATTVRCDQPSGYAALGGDCDDDDVAYNPGASETDCADPADYNCDGSTGYADMDADGWAACEECDDTDATQFPGADELCNGEDDDCDGTVDEDDALDASTWYADSDGDHYGDAATSHVSCAAPRGYIADDSDCDDSDDTVHPAATERCDGIDNDCDALIDDDDDSIADQATWFADADADGYGDATASVDACVQPSGHVADETDCDDSDAAVHPAATELCDGIDNDCDGSTDEDDAADVATWYADVDADSYGDPAAVDIDCEQPSGYVADDSDCDDGDAAVHPAAIELCNGVDDDCDGATDEDDADDADTWYADADADGYGDPGVTTAACEQPSGYVADDSDCDDGDDAIHPAATELCNGADDDCDGVTDEDDAADAGTWYMDGDGDGYGDASASTVSCAAPSGYLADATDCDDGDAAIHPAATELCNGADDDCDGTVDEDDAADAATWYADDDADGYGDASATHVSCAAPSGHVADATDCDDNDDDIHPAATELCNGADDDCDGATDEDDAADAATWYADADADGYGDASASHVSCAAPSGHVADATDCDDGDAAIRPGAAEICDGLDNDCDGLIDDDDSGVGGRSTWYLDYDRDSFGDAAVTRDACDQPSGYVADSTDCDDRDASAYPGATEICDGADNDCDGVSDEADATDASTWYADSDADGYGDPSSSQLACTMPTGHVSDATDCDDSDSAVHPGATETCNGTDDDCDGTVDEASASDASTWYTDADSDSYGDATSATVACDQPTGHVSDATDCDDGDAAVHPAASEICDSIDNDCDGLVDDADGSVSGRSTWYLDYDGDSYGDSGRSAASCDQPSGYVADATDCDDVQSAINPGATEYCNGTDDDCDGSTDEDDAADAATWYADDDVDGYGDPSDSTTACSMPSTHVADATDCDDSDATVNPAGSEDCEDGQDNDCDGATDCDDDDCLSVSACMDSWYEDFEDGVWDDTWISDGSGHSRSLDSSTSAGGSTSFTQTASTGGHYHGVHAELPGEQYEYVGFWVRTSACLSSGANAYVVIGDDSTSSNNGIVFFAMVNNSLSVVSPSSWVSLEPCVANRWFQVELFFDWSTTNYDVWIDGSYNSTRAFRSSSSTEITRIYLYNYSAGYQAWWDEIEVY